MSKNMVESPHLIMTAGYILLVPACVWRQRVRSGGRTNCAVIGAPGNTRGDSAIGELLQGLPAREMFRFTFGNKRPPHINVGEMRARREASQRTQRLGIIR